MYKLACEAGVELAIGPWAPIQAAEADETAYVASIGTGCRELQLHSLTYRAAEYT